MNTKMTKAIQNKKLLHFYYKNEVRRVEPHIYGIDTKGHEALSAYQIGKGWRFFHVNEITSLESSDEHFYSPRTDYNSNDDSFSTVYARI